MSKVTKREHRIAKVWIICQSCGHKTARPTEDGSGFGYSGM